MSPAVLDEEQCLSLKVASMLLGYPDSNRRIKWQLLQAAASSLPDEARAVLEQVCAIEDLTLQDAYVQAFDLNQSAALYLTVHELGDSRQRGAALFELRQMLEQVGFEEPPGELPDYLPLLLEFVAVCPGQAEPLLARLGAVACKIRDALAQDHPYRAVLQLAAAAIGAGDACELLGEEKPDLATLPYPIDYQ